MRKITLKNLLIITAFLIGLNTNASVQWEQQLQIPSEIKNEIDSFLELNCPLTNRIDLLFIKKLTIQSNDQEKIYKIELSTLPLPDKSIHMELEAFLYERGHERDIFTGINSFKTILDCK